MSQYNKTVLTNAGLELAKKANAGQAKFEITRAVTSADDWSNKTIQDIEAVTAIPNIMQQGTILDTEEVESNNSVIGVSLCFTNKDLSAGYQIKIIGVYVKEEGQDKDFLYAVTTAVTPEYMPDFSDGVLYRFNMQMYLVIGKAQAVNVVINDGASVTHGQFDKYKGEVTADLEKIENAHKEDMSHVVKSASINGGDEILPDEAGKLELVVPDPDLSKYVNVDDLKEMLNTKANASDVYTKSQIDSDFSARDTQINTKANTSDVYTKSDVDSALATDRGRLGKLEGAQTVDSPDFNSITATGVYYITNNTPANIKNNPASQWGVLVVSNGNGNRTSQVYYPDDGSPQWCRLLNESNWLPWYQLSTRDDVSNATNLANQAQATADTKANASDVYTKTDMDGKLSTVGTVKTVDEIQPDSSGNVDLQPEFNSLLGRNNLLTDDEMDISKATKKSPAQNAISNAKYANGVTTFHYCGVANYEMFNWKIAVQPNTNYEFIIIANSTNQLTGLSSAQTYIPITVDSSGAFGNTSTVSNGDLGKGQLNLPWQGIETEKIIFNSQNYSNIYLAYNFGVAQDGVNTDITLQTTLLKADPIQSQIDNLQNQVNNIDSTRTPVVAGASGDDLFSFKTNQIRLYDGNGKACKNLPPASNTQWFTVQYVFEGPNDNGVAIYRTPFNEIWMAGCDSGSYTTYFSGGGWVRVANSNDITNLQNQINQQNQTIQSLTTRLTNAENEISYIKANYIEGKQFPASQEAQAVAWENANPQGIAFITSN